MNLLKGTLFLKIAALALAIVTYYFVHGEVLNGEKKAVDPSYKLIKLTAKSLPVRTHLASSAPEGYRINSDRVSANPERIIAVGPEALLEEVSSAETALIDVSENTKTVAKKIPLESVAGIHLIGDPYEVEVVVPIEKVEAPSATPSASAAPAVASTDHPS